MPARADRLHPWHRGRFGRRPISYEHSVQAARQLGRRAVLILNDPHNRMATLPDGVAFDYRRSPNYSPAPRPSSTMAASARRALAMRRGGRNSSCHAAWDQPDNAERSLASAFPAPFPAGVCPCARGSRSAAPARRPRCARRTAQIAEQMQNEDGTFAACSTLETLLTPQ